MFIVGCWWDGVCEHGDKSSAPQAHLWIRPKPSESSSVTIYSKIPTQKSNPFFFSRCFLHIIFSKAYSSYFSFLLFFVASWTLFSQTILGWHTCVKVSSVSCHILGVVSVCGATGLQTSIIYSSVSCHILGVVSVCGATGLQTSIIYSSVSCHIPSANSIFFCFLSYPRYGSSVPEHWFTNFNDIFFCFLSHPWCYSSVRDKWVTNFNLVFLLLPAISRVWFQCAEQLVGILVFSFIVFPNISLVWLQCAGQLFTYFHSISFCFLSYLWCCSSVWDSRFHTSIKFPSVSCHILSVVLLCGKAGWHTFIQFFFFFLSCSSVRKECAGQLVYILNFNSFFLRICMRKLVGILSAFFCFLFLSPVWLQCAGQLADVHPPWDQQDLLPPEPQSRREQHHGALPVLLLRSQVRIYWIYYVEIKVLLLNADSTSPVSQRKATHFCVLCIVINTTCDWTKPKLCIVLANTVCDAAISDSTVT